MILNLYVTGITDPDVTNFNDKGFLSFDNRKITAEYENNILHIKDENYSNDKSRFFLRNYYSEFKHKIGGTIFIDYLYLILFEYSGIKSLYVLNGPFLNLTDGNNCIKVKHYLQLFPIDFLPPFNRIKNHYKEYKGTEFTEDEIRKARILGIYKIYLNNDINCEKIKFRDYHFLFQSFDHRQSYSLDRLLFDNIFKCNNKFFSSEEELYEAFSKDDVEISETSSVISSHSKPVIEESEKVAHDYSVENLNERKNVKEINRPQKLEIPKKSVSEGQSSIVTKNAVHKSLSEQFYVYVGDSHRNITEKSDLSKIKKSGKKCTSRTSQTSSENHVNISKKKDTSASDSAFLRTSIPIRTKRAPIRRIMSVLVFILVLIFSFLLLKGNISVYTGWWDKLSFQTSFLYDYDHSGKTDVKDKVFIIQEYLVKAGYKQKVNGQWSEETKKNIKLFMTKHKVQFKSSDVNSISKCFSLFEDFDKNHNH
jgi:hypothetical protein